MAYSEIKSSGNSGKGTFVNYGVSLNPSPGSTHEIHHDEELGEVLDIILNDSHPDYKNPEDVGKILIKLFHSHGIHWARPEDNRILNYPLIHEVVVTKPAIGFEYLDENISGRNLPTTLYYNKVLSTFNNINNNAMNNISFDDNSNKNTSLGNTFKNGFNKFYYPFPNEGETIIRGRCGQGFIFGSENSTGDNPSTLIFNKYNTDTNNQLSYSDLNGYILFWSGRHEPKVDIYNDRNLSTFGKKNVNFKGNSVFINDDQVIINSSKNSFIFSDESIGISSRNLIGIQSENINIWGDQISLGGKSNQPAVLGKKLSSLLRSLITKIISMKIIVAGTTGMIDPSSTTDISSLITDINDILSNNITIK